MGFNTVRRFAVQSLNELLAYLIMIGVFVTLSLVAGRRRARCNRFWRAVPSPFPEWGERKTPRSAPAEGTEPG